MYKPTIVKQILVKDVTINELADLIQKSKRVVTYHSLLKT